MWIEMLHMRSTVPPISWPGLSVCRRGVSRRVSQPGHVALRPCPQYLARDGAHERLQVPVTYLTGSVDTGTAFLLGRASSLDYVYMKEIIIQYLNCIERGGARNRTPPPTPNPPASHQSTTPTPIWLMFINFIDSISVFSPPRLFRVWIRCIRWSCTVVSCAPVT